jgi:hypothetical protein
MIYIVPIEQLDMRYSLQWFNNIPKQLENRGAQVTTINGKTIAASDEALSQGAFLNFSNTNYFKASQVQIISKLFTDKKIKAGDKFLVTDAWNFAVTAIRYMSELLDVPVEIHGIWHAGAYDPSDILGMKMAKPWPWHQERAWFHACDYNYFATQFHADMFCFNLNVAETDRVKVVISGQPHELLVETINGYNNTHINVRSVIWPHRNNSDKQPDIARDLKMELFKEPYAVAMDLGYMHNLTKDEFYKVLRDRRVMFSCSLHENLGISVMEGVLLNVIPVLPSRCSYTEMYLPEFLYPSEWTSSFENYLLHKNELLNFIADRLDYPENYATAMQQQRQLLLDKYLNANVMYDKLCS